MRAATVAARAAARLVAACEGTPGVCTDTLALSKASEGMCARRGAAPSFGRRVSTSAPTHADDPPSPSSSPSSSWLPSWARARLPTSLGGTPAPDGGGDGSDLTLDAYRTQIGRARRVAALGGAIGGAARASSDPHAQGNLRLYEAIIDAMEPRHRADLASFDGAARARVAASAGASPAQVDDCLAKYEWTRAAMGVLADRKVTGQALPTSMEELEAMVGRRGGGGGSGSATSAPAACPFAGRAPPPGRNAVCGRTGKKWKNCCGGK